MVVPNGSAFKVIDGARGKAQVQRLESLTEWDQFHWDFGLPKLVHLRDADDIPAPPEYMMGTDIVDIIVLPFVRMGVCSGLLSVSARNVPFGSSLTISNEVRGSLEIGLGAGRALLVAHPYPGEDF